MGQGEPVDVGRVAAALGGRSVVLIGMMGAGKTSVGKRLAAKLALPFVDADAEIEAGAQLTISEIFERFGEAYFRDGERKVIARLLNGGPLVLATGGGAFMNPVTRDNIAARGVSIWLKPDFDILLARVRKKSNRPLLKTADPEETLRRLLEERSPIYALADFTIELLDGSHDSVVEAILRRLATAPCNDVRPVPPARRRVEVPLGARAYSILIGPGLIDQAGVEIAKIAPRVNCAVVTDARVAPLYLERLTESLRQAGLRSTAIICPPGEATKRFAEFARVSDALIEARIERRDIVIALGGGVIGDLAGFCAATVRRGVRLVQIPTTLLAQVNSSVGGKTGINSRHGKNLDWRLSSAVAGAGRHDGPRHFKRARFSRRLRRSRQVWAHRRPPLFRVSGIQLARDIRRRSRASRSDRDQLRSEGARRRRRRDGARRACAAQFRSHLWACLREPNPL